jgi:uncharacterized protein YuzE
MDCRVEPGNDDEQDQTMRMRVDHAADAVYLNLTDRPIKDSEEVACGIVLDCDDEGRIVGMEMEQRESVASFLISEGDFFLFRYVGWHPRISDGASDKVTLVKTHSAPIFRRIIFVERASQRISVCRPPFAILRFMEGGHNTDRIDQLTASKIIFLNQFGLVLDLE